MLRSIMRLSVLILILVWAAAPAKSASIAIENASFESPVVDPNGFGAFPVTDGWTEIDVDALGSTNTGVFANTAEGSPDHIVNADGDQLAFLGSQSGNALEQDLTSTYKVGCDYRLSVGVGVSGRFPPSSQAPADSLELVLYYRDGNEPVDIASVTIEALGLSVTQLKDFSLYVPTVDSKDAWAGKNIGVALRAAGQAGGFWDLDNVRLAESLPVSITIENASFESPVVDPNGFGAFPVIDGWTEIDVDTLGSTNTGVFANTASGSEDHIVNADGDQLAFLGSESGNALEQDLTVTYKVGCDYRLTVGVGISGRFPPSPEAPVDSLDLVLYYRDGNEPVEIASETVEAAGLSATQLQDVSVCVPTVGPDDAWAGQGIGVATRAGGQAGGFWDLDNVRLAELLPVSIAMENASFESPVVDPNGFGAFPVIDGWTEIDRDALGSTNTGVFVNTPVDSPDHIVNAHGSQLAFLGSERGNALEQLLEGTYKVGSSYRLTAGVAISINPLSQLRPDDAIEIAFFYVDGHEPMDIAVEVVSADGLSSTFLRDFSAHLLTVEPNDVWAGKRIGVAIRAAGQAGGFWDLDNVRLGESLPIAGLTPVAKE